MSNLYEKLKLVEPDEIIDIYFRLFIFDFGEALAVNLNEKVAYSNKTDDYLNQVLRSHHQPTSKEILNLLSGTSFLFFANVEKLCYSAFILMQYWKVTGDTNGIQVDKDLYKKTLVEIAYNCRKLKLKKRDSMFDRYFKDLSDLIHKKEVNNLVKSFYPSASIPVNVTQNECRQLKKINHSNTKVSIDDREYELLEITTQASFGEEDYTLYGYFTEFIETEYVKNTKNNNIHDTYYITETPKDGITKDGRRIQVFQIKFGY